MTKIRVLLADDQDIIRTGLTIILNYQADIEVVGQAADGVEVVELAKQLQPDVILMDIKMPRLNGIQATRQVMAALPRTQIIILTTYDTDDWVFDGIRAGAVGYLLKDTSGDHLAEAVRGVLAQGGLYCQWIPLYQLSEPEFDSIAASFLDVFPHTTLWRGDFSAGQPGVALVGHLDPQGLDANKVDARVRSLMLAPDPTNPYLSHPAGLWLYFVGPLDSTSPRFRLAPRNRDGNPWIELSGPRSHLRIARGEAQALVGRPLLVWLNQLLALPPQGAVIASVDEEHRKWRSLGAQLFEASLLSFEGDNAAADRLGFGALAQLPPELQLAVTGRAIPRD